MDTAPAVEQWLAVALAIYALGTGIGEILKETRFKKAKRVGRAFKLGTPILTGEWAFLQAMNGIHWNWGVVWDFSVMFAFAMLLIGLAEQSGLLKPIEDD